MSFSREKTRDYFLLDTDVENIFINEYMAAAPGDYVKVYLFALMYADIGSPLSNEQISRELRMDFEDVLKAWTYWEKHGVVRKIMDSDRGLLDYDIEFVMLKRNLYGSGSDGEEPVEDSMSAVMVDDGVKDMLQDIEKELGRTINSSEAMEVTSWIKDYAMPPEAVSYAFRYCAGIGKRSIRYTGSVVRNWASDGLKTVMDIERYISESEKKKYTYRRVFEALVFRRNATEEVQRIMDRWFGDMGLSIEVVLEACRKTSGISSPNINYVNKVLENWKKERKAPPASKKGESSASDINRYYESVRRREEADAERRRREVYSKVPRIKEIEDELKSCNAQVSKMIVSDRTDKKEALEEIRKSMEEKNAERAFLLTDNGFEIDYMDVHYRCPVCRDTGLLETGEKCKCFGEITKEKIEMELKRNEEQGRIR